MLEGADVARLLDIFIYYAALFDNHRMLLNTNILIWSICPCKQIVVCLLYPSFSNCVFSPRLVGRRQVLTRLL